MSIRVVPVIALALLLSATIVIQESNAQEQRPQVRPALQKLGTQQERLAVPQGSWSHWESLGEHPSSAPSAVSGGDGHLMVFFRGSDGHLRGVWWGGKLWHRGRDIGPIVVPRMTMSPEEKIASALADRLADALDFDDGSGSGRAAPAPAVGDTLYNREGNHIPVDSAPGCVMKAPRHIDCFVLDYAGRVWHRWYRGSEGWDRWQIMNHGGPVASSSPTATSWSERRLDVFTRGSDGQLLHQWWDGERWGAWQDLGGIAVESGRISVRSALTSAPSCVSTGPGRVDCFARGEDRAAYHISARNGTWSVWQSLGGSLTSAPTATASGDDRIDLLARGDDNQLIHTVRLAGRWQPWQDLGGELSSAPSCVARTGVIDCFARGNHELSGATDVLLHRWYLLPE